MFRKFQHVGGTADMGAYEFQSPVRYVNLNNTTPASPFTNWITAATNIQDAIDVANAGDFIVVSNGTYNTGGRVVYGSLTNRVVINKPIIVQSVNGPAVTRIEGYRLPSGSGLGDNAVRCACLTNGATLIGFTLTNGATRNFGGGDLNQEQCGGALWAETNGLATVSNCLFIANSAAYYGGGTYGGTIINSSFITNRAYQGGGANAGNLINCVFYSNQASAGGGGSRSSTLANCTLARNTTSDLYGGGSLGGTLRNCILHLNIATGRTNNYSVSLLNYCCTTPLPTNGVGNITNEPVLVDVSSGDFRLQSNSPCINAGNNAYVSNGTDLDGNPRIKGGTVDIGACEFQSPTSIISYAWLQQYGLPTDGSADSMDSDIPTGDGMNNWQEWKTGTNPTNASSVLKMVSATATNNPPGLVVTWQSVSGINYFLQSGTSLETQPVFSTIQTNLAGQAGTTSYTDTNAAGSGPYFYRVGVP